MNVVVKNNKYSVQKSMQLKLLSTISENGFRPNPWQPASLRSWKHLPEKLHINKLDLSLEFFLFFKHFHACGSMFCHPIWWKSKSGS